MTFPASTISYADLYGGAPPGRSKGETSAPDTAQASGKAEPSAEKTPAFFWAALVGMLVMVRFLWEKGK